LKNIEVSALDITVKSRKMKIYRELPKKYVKMMKPMTDGDRATWSGPIADGAFVYYVYATRVQGDCDKVFRFIKEEHDGLLSEIATDTSGLGLDRGWVMSNEPFITCDPVF